MNFVGNISDEFNENSPDKSIKEKSNHIEIKTRKRFIFVDLNIADWEAEFSTGIWD